MWRLIVMLAACRQSAPISVEVPVSGRGPVVMAVHDAAPQEQGDWIRPPACTAAEAKARVAELFTLRQHVYTDGTDPRVILEELRLLLTRPCLRHARPTVSIPASTTLAALGTALEQGLDSSLETATEGLLRWAGERLLVLPPDIMVDLDADARRTLTPMICTAQTGCGRAASYIVRAEQVFDMHASEATANLKQAGRVRASEIQLPVETCTTWINDETERPTTFEAWASCAAAKAPKNRRFAATHLRAPESGWLVLRGLRQWDDSAHDVRAYDLATGAAYIVPGRGPVHAVADPAAKPGPGPYAGRVSVEHLRELAFLVLTREAIVPVRTEAIYAVVPPQISFELTVDGAFPEQSSWPRNRIISSDETQIDFMYFDATMKKTGRFTWPEVFDWVDIHIVQLTRVMEAGLEPGCAPAKLPSLSSLDGGAQLEQQLGPLRKQACRGAK